MRTEWRQFRELVRLFCGRFLSNDLICLDGDTSATLTHILALVAAPGIILPILENWLYGTMPRPLWFRDLYSINEKGLYIGFSMAVLGIVTVLEWDTLLPDRRDYLVLRPFPVRLGAMLAARIAALAAFWAVFTVVMNAVPAFMFPAVVIQTEPMASFLWFVRCHALAIVAANAFVFLAIVAVQAVLMNVLGWRWFRRFSPLAQLLLIALLLVMFFRAPGLVGAMHPARPAPAALQWFPPAWFVGLYQYELGWRQAVFSGMAARAWMGVGAMALVAAAGFAASYHRHVRRSLEAMETTGAAPGRLTTLAWRFLDRVALRTPAERAAFHFVWITLARSRQHRAMLAAWAGAGFALVFQILVGILASGSSSWWKPDGALLPVSAILSFFLLCGLRYVFTVPAELGANWIFRMASSDHPDAYMPGVCKAVIAAGILPLSALMLLAHVALWGWTAAAIHALFTAVAGILLMDALLAGFEKVPFTCAYVPGSANVKSLWAVYVMVFAVYMAFFSQFERLVLRDASRVWWLLLFAAVCRIGLRAYRRELQQQAQGFQLRFDERAEPAVRTLNILQP